jgi:hypothetical protein
MKKLLFIIFLKFIALGVSAQMTFIHPGGLNSKEELDFVKAKIKAGEQPWTNVFNQVKGLAINGVNALTCINSNSKDSDISRNDARKAYANALIWYFTDEEIYAQQAIVVLNAWSGLQGFNGGNDQDKLQAGWIGALFAPAAEIMRTCSEWTPADIEKFQAMFRRAFYPQLNTASDWNGNVDLTQIDAMMNIAVFNEDENEFNSGVIRFNKRIRSYFYQVSDGEVTPIEGDGGNINAFWSKPSKWIDGLTQETCRDNDHHAQFALASALHSAEVAWHQGVDLYTPNSKRLTDAMELMALQVLSGSMQGTCTNNITTTDVYNTWEVGYSHYHFRMGLSLPNTGMVLTEKVRVNSGSDWNIFYETLTHADIPRYCTNLSH